MGRKNGLGENIGAGRSDEKNGTVPNLMGGRGRAGGHGGQGKGRTLSFSPIF